MPGALLKICAIALMLIGVGAYGEETSSASENIALAHKLFADSIPEDRSRIEYLLNNAIRIQPDSAEAYADLGRYLLWQVASGLRQQNEALMALEFAEHVKDLTPESPAGDFLRCESLIVLGKKSEAEATCQQAETAFPSHKETEMFRARLYAESEPQKALDASQRALALGGDINLLSATIANAIQQLNDPGTQGDALVAYAVIHPDRWLWHRAGMAYAAEKNHIKAKEAFETAIALGNTLESRLQLALLQANELKKYDAAITNFGQLLEDLKKRPDTRSSLFAGIHARMAIVYLEMGTDSKAIEHAQKAVAIDVTETSIIQALYETFMAKKKAGAMESAMQHAALENPFFGYAHVALGDLATQRKNFRQAHFYYTKFVGLMPDDDFGYAKRAHASYSMHEYKLALEDFDRALNIHPTIASHHYNRACMLSLLGNTEESLSSLRAALSLDSNLSKLASSDADLLNLRNAANLKAQVAALQQQFSQTNSKASASINKENID